MMRRLAVDLNIPFIATIQAAEAAVQAMEEARTGELQVVPLQEYGRAARKKRSKL
jgi:carbamoyl-phosphate synthase large subunit